MMRWQPAPFVVGSNADDSKDFAAQDNPNVIPERGPEGARSPWMLRQAPGLFGCGTVGSGPHRAARDCEGALLIVSGTALYHVRADRSALNVGTIPGTTRCKIAHNAVDEALIVNGTDAYLYNWQTGVFAKVTDTSLRGAADVDYLGHYFVTLMANRRGWQHSDLEDGSDWSGLDTYDAEAFPDKLRAVVADHGQLLVLGERTGEWFANEPLSANEAFQNTRSVIPRGCAATHSVCRLDGTIFWLDDLGNVCKLEGQTQPQVISTPAIAQAISRCTLTTAFAFIYEDRGHAIYYLTFQDGQTWGYDVSTGLWHRRQSYGLDRWRLNTLFKWDGRWYGGSYNDGTVYTLDWDYAFDGASTVPNVRTVRPPVWHAHGNRQTIAGVQLHVSVRESAEPSLTSFWSAIVVTNPLPDPAVGQVVSHQYAQTGGVGTITWSYTGTLPAGLSLSSTTGILSGTVTTQGTYNWTVIATDSLAHTGTLAEEVTTLPVSLMTGAKRYAGVPATLYTLTDSAYTLEGSQFRSGSAVSENGLSIAYGKTGDGANQYYMGRWNTSTRVYDEASITDYQPITEATGYLLAITPNGQWVLAVHRHHTGNTISSIYAYKWSGTAFVYTAELDISTVASASAVAMSPDGDKFAISYAGGLLRTFSLNTTTGAMAQTGSLDLTWQAVALDWRGGYIACGRNPSSGTNVKIVNATALTVAASTSGYSMGLMFSPDADYLYAHNVTTIASYSFSGSALTLGNTAAFGFNCALMAGNAARTHVFITPAIAGSNNKIYALSGTTITELTSVGTAGVDALWSNL